MSKTYLSLKHQIALFIILFATITIEFSCKKGQELSANKESIESARIWFKNQKLAYEADWENAQVLENEHIRYVVVQSKIFYSGSLNVISNIIIDFSNDKPRGYLVEFINTSLPKKEEFLIPMYINLLSRNDSKINDNLKGTALLFTLEHQFIDGWKVNANNTLIKIKSKYENNLKSRMQMKFQVAETEICTDWYWIEYNPSTGQVYQQTYMYTSCTSNSGGGGSGGGSEGDNSNKEIIDSLTGYPCAQALLTKIKTPLNTDIGNLIKNTFAKNDLVNITFSVDRNLTGTNTDGAEQTGNNSELAAEFFIGLNPDILMKSSQEYVLVTMYHEALHAFFGRKLQTLGVVEFNRQYEGVNVSGGRLLGVNNDAHIPMAYQNYVKGLKDIIMAFNPSFDEDRAWILAKTGIIQNLPEESKINDQERDTTKPGYTGTKCP